jgi:hypothetical protein
VSWGAQTNAGMERPSFRYIREDFFLGGVFRNLDDLNGQLRRWLDMIANPACAPRPTVSSTRPSLRNRNHHLKCL